jgi:integrase
MRGLGRIFKRGSVYWIAYYHRGHRYRESSHSESESQARRLLKQRLGEITAGRFIGPSEDRLTFDALVADLENDYKANNRRSLETVRFHVARLQRFFGFDRAVDITPDRVKAYQVQRLDEEASRATINREVACLGRMLSLAVNSGKLSRKPKFQLLDGERVRQGFLEHGDFLVLLGNLPAHLESLTEFLYLSGWRKGEALKLEWKDVDLQGRTVRLRMENSKNKEARILPLTDRLWEIVQERTKNRRLDCPYVFHHEGQKIGDFRKAWKTACKKSGLAGIIVHDLRRCAARNLSRAGVPEAVAMEITGHKTRSMYRRYRIVDERDLREATERLQAHLQEQPKTSVIVPIIIAPRTVVK